MKPIPSATDIYDLYASWRGRAISFAFDHRIAFLVACLALNAAIVGCMSEQSFPMRQGDAVKVDIHLENDHKALTTRQWLRQAHGQLKHLIHAGDPPALVTEELVTEDGRPIDVMAYFGIRFNQLQKLFGNYSGLLHTAQSVGGEFTTGKPNPWPGFEEVWIPVRPDLSLYGWLGMARADRNVTSPILDSNCIVLLPGLMGHNDISRTRDLAQALIAAGHHVLAVELRGHGQTDTRYPDLGYNFGVTEVEDLMIVSEWLEDRPHIHSTGMIGFCWGANEAMISAWFDGRTTDDPSLSPRLRALHDPPRPRRHFTAGVIAFSPTLRFEEILEILKSRRRTWNEPIYKGLQDIVIYRAKAKGYPNPSGDLRWLIDREYERSILNYPNAVEEGLTFLRWMPFRHKPAHDKTSSIRIPTLIVAAANDPLVGGQELADFIAGVKNPNVAALLTRGGGHVGFAAWNRQYYFNLILAFFDTRHGPGAQRP